MKPTIDLESPNRQIAMTARLAINAIELIRDYMAELAEISKTVYLDDERASVESKILDCEEVWDQLSEAIESVDEPPCGNARLYDQGRCAAPDCDCFPPKVQPSR